MSWREVYFHYDDDALAVFANVGLLRRARKDIDNGKVTPINLATGTFDCDGQQVKLDEFGIQNAACNCIASGCCKHILSAVLWVQSTVIEDETVVALQETQPLLVEILALDPELIIKQTPKADCRLAVRILQDWQGCDLKIDDQGSQFKIYLPSFDEPIIFMRGNGFQGILSSLPDKQKKALHLAAVAKVCIQSNQPWKWPDDLAVMVDPQLILSEDDKAVIETIQAFIQDMLRQGLSHISQSSAVQLHLLNMSARAESLPRLANYLKSLSQQVKLLADRHFTVDESVVLRFIAQISAYLYQLSYAQENRLAALRGLVKRQYEDKAAILKLTPVDAQWWQSQSGAIGMTLSFWDNQEKKVIQCSQARSNRLDPMFNRINVWQSLALWKQTADRLMRTSFELHAPRLSEEGRLSAAGETYAVSKSHSFISHSDYQQLQSEYGFIDWPQAANYLSNLQNDDIYDPILLHIDSYEQLHWNETEQSILWMISDRNHHKVILRLNWNGNESHKIEELRFITKQKLSIAAISVQVIYQHQEIQLVPKTLWLKKEQGIELFYLDFDSIPRKKQNSNFMSKILDYMAKKQQNNLNLAAKPTLAQQITMPIYSLLETLACTGRQQFSQAQQVELQSIIRTLQDLGMVWFAHQIEPLVSTKVLQPQELLRLVYLCDKFERTQVSLPFVLKP